MLRGTQCQHTHRGPLGRFLDDPPCLPALERLTQTVGLKIPADWDWNQFVDLARKITKRQGAGQSQFALRSVGTGLNFFNAMIWEFGGDVWNKDLSQSLLHLPGSVGAPEFTADLYLKHQVVPSAAEAEGQGDMWKGGRIAFVLNTCRCNVPNHPDIKDFELATAPLPKGASGRITRDGANAIGIVKGSRISRRPGASSSGSSAKKGRRTS